MATEVIIPALGVVVEKVKIVNWFKSEGERVEKGEPLLEIESDKVVTEIPSPASGTLGVILYPEGAEVPVTQVVGMVVSEGEKLPELGKVPAPTVAAPVARSSIEKVVPPSSIRAAPAARKIAEEKGVDLSLVMPTGPHGTIMKKDVETYLASGVSRESRRFRVLPEGWRRIFMFH
jgi:pyruvate dehydrogenase E2 component (dihydrolipoamide acetyltransferase)